MAIPLNARAPHKERRPTRRFLAEVTASVMREGAHLYIQQEPLPRTELYANTDQEYSPRIFPGSSASGLEVAATLADRVSMCTAASFLEPEPNRALGEAFDFSRAFTKEDVA